MINKVATTVPQRIDALRQAIAAALMAVGLLLSALPAVAADPVFGFSVNSSGNFSANQEVNALWRVNLQTGVATRVFDAVRDDTGYLDLEALAFDGQGRLFGADDESKTLVRVGTTTGRAITVSPPEQSNMGVPLSPPLDFGMTFTCDDQLLVVSATEQSLFEADIQKGTLKRLGAAGALGVALADLATRDDVIYAIDMGQTAAGPTAAPALYRLSVDPVAVERIGALGPAVLPYRSAGLAFDEQGQLWAVTNRRNINAQDFPSQIVRIDIETGTAQAVAETQVANDDAVVAGQPLVGLESLAIAPPALCGASNDLNPAFVSVGSPRSSDWDASPIPALSPPMLLLLTLLLGILGALALNMQRSQGAQS
jgi:hypothetical protein